MRLPNNLLESLADTLGLESFLWLQKGENLIESLIGKKFRVPPETLQLVVAAVRN